MDILGAPETFRQLAEAIGESYPDVTVAIPINESDFAAYTPDKVMIGYFLAVGCLGYCIGITEEHTI